MSAVCLNLNAMDERRQQEDKQLHGGHALVEELGTGVLVLLLKGAAVERSRPDQSRARAGARSPRRGSLVPNWLEERAASAAASGPAVAQAGFMVALLRGVQQHPVQSVKQFGLSHAQLVLVACWRLDMFFL